MEKLKNTLVIYQPRFLGDIIFISGLAQVLSKKYDEIIIPVDSDFISSFRIHQYITGVKFIPLLEYYVPAQKMLPGFYHFSSHILLNLSTTSIFRQHMGMKYKLCSLPIEQWRGLVIQRNPEREAKLNEILNIASGEKYNLINSMYSNKKSQNFKPKIQNEFRNIFLNKIDGFNLFDWMGVIENAHSIHTVHTSLQYIIDLIPTKTSDLHIYPRSEIYEPHAYYDYLFEKNYNYHPYPKTFHYTVVFNFKLIKNFLFRLINYVLLKISTFFVLNNFKDSQWMKH
jgi:hypothetical protein